MGGKPKGSTSLNPWEALFASATRPQAVISSYNTDEKKKNDTSDVTSSCKSTNLSTTTTNNTNKGGYTILIQHSITPKSQRQYALSSTMAQNNNTTDKSSNNKGSSASLYTSLSSGISTMNINNRSSHQQQHNSISSSGGYGISGPFLVKQSFDELCHKCNGAVIFVSTIGNNSAILDMNEFMSTNSGICDDEMMVDSSYQAACGDNDDGNNTQHPLEKNRNAIQMFKRHGACVDLSSNSFGWDDDDDDSDNKEGKDECDSCLHKCSMNKLQPIANAVRTAALSIESRRGLSLEEQKCQRQIKQQQLHQQPIPIVFESMTSLLNIHGVDKVGVLLKSLGRVALSSSSSDHQSTTDNNIILLSPIVVPVLYESLQPSEHRSLEDVSDAFVHLNLVANSNSIHHHESSSADSNSTSVMSGIMDLVRRGGSGGLGGKLIRHCIPFHIMKSVSNSSSTSMTKDARDSCYWILEHEENEEAAEDNDNKKSSVTKSKKEISSSSATNQQQDSSDTSATTATTSSRPRIFLQDDDPEYDDYDEEEDLDDDLDL